MIVFNHRPLKLVCRDKAKMNPDAIRPLPVYDRRGFFYRTARELLVDGNERRQWFLVGIPDDHHRAIQTRGGDTQSATSSLDGFEREQKHKSSPRSVLFVRKKWRLDETILLPSQWNTEVVVEVGANNEGKVWV